MDEKALNRDVGRLGFPLMETTEAFDANETLVEVVKSRDLRLWEGFPVMLANAAEEHDFASERVNNHLNDSDDVKNFQDLVHLSLALYQRFHLSFSWAHRMQKGLSADDAERLNDFKSSLSHDESFSIGSMKISPDRLLRTFQNYFEKDVEKTRKLKERHEELSLEYALSQLFSPKQKELFKKKLNGEVMTKIEKEYYSRKVKKKVAALANPELHRLAQRLMEY